MTDRTKVASCDMGFWKDVTDGCPVCHPGPCKRTADEQEDRREAIARIISPKAAECAGNVVNGPTSNYWKNAWANWGRLDWSEALDKTDAILALAAPSEGARDSALEEALRRLIEAAEAMAWDANNGTADEAIEAARAALRTAKPEQAGRGRIDPYRDR